MSGLRARGSALGAAALALTLASGPAQAADFFAYLKCKGKVQAGGKSTPGHVELALRDNNMTALIQKSNTLPVGQRLKYEVSPAAYSMTYKVPVSGTTEVHSWWAGFLFTWQPNLKNVSTVRMSIDRQSGELEGEMLNVQAEVLANLAMRCDAVDEDSLPPPKF